MTLLGHPHNVEQRLLARINALLGGDPYVYDGLGLPTTVEQKLLDSIRELLESGGGGGGAVSSVNGETGAVTLDAEDVGADPEGSAAAAQAASLQKTSNLSDLANAGTARTNLGLGDSATLDVGTGAGTVAAGDDSRLPSSDEKSALAGTDGTPAAGNPYVTDSDARMTDARTAAEATISQAEAEGGADTNRRIITGERLGQAIAALPTRSLRETSGPTVLTLGAVADGQVIERVGSTAVGRTRDATVLRRAFSRVRGVPGWQYHGVAAGPAGPSGGKHGFLWATIKPITISAARIAVGTAGGAGQEVRLGLYSVADPLTSPGSSLIDGALVADFGKVAVDSQGEKAITGLSLTLAPGLYLSVIQYPTSVSAALSMPSGSARFDDFHVGTVTANAFTMNPFWINSTNTNGEVAGGLASTVSAMTVLNAAATGIGSRQGITFDWDDA